MVLSRWPLRLSARRRDQPIDFGRRQIFARPDLTIASPFRRPVRINCPINGVPRNQRQMWFCH
jgi:hypothetical protein